ncbi:hypothetical protein DFP72DRAFT_846034 [Ephemerocybe angulata]|uniref:Uncharacterized protein n=1 Tax=Ephemerocybe angulata TaxID=980116 RepID=A0A8H6I1M2_9AGAR|nr:hypothetical protein DFP72DRAFT_846034 [Tulosesus angulatus]
MALNLSYEDLLAILPALEAQKPYLSTKALEAVECLERAAQVLEEQEWSPEPSLRQRWGIQASSPSPPLQWGSPSMAPSSSPPRPSSRMSIDTVRMELLDDGDMDADFSFGYPMAEKSAFDKSALSLDELVMYVLLSNARLRLKLDAWLSRPHTESNSSSAPVDGVHGAEAEVVVLVEEVGGMVVEVEVGDMVMEAVMVVEEVGGMVVEVEAEAAVVVEVVEEKILVVAVLGVTKDPENRLGQYLQKKEEEEEEEEEESSGDEWRSTPPVPLNPPKRRPPGTPYTVNGGQAILEAQKLNVGATAVLVTLCSTAVRCMVADDNVPPMSADVPTTSCDFSFSEICMANSKHLSATRGRIWALLKLSLALPACARRERFWRLDFNCHSEARAKIYEDMGKEMIRLGFDPIDIGKCKHFYNTGLKAAMMAMSGSSICLRACSGSETLPAGSIYLFIPLACSRIKAQFAALHLNMVDALSTSSSVTPTTHPMLRRSYPISFDIIFPELLLPLSNSHEYTLNCTDIHGSNIFWKLFCFDMAIGSLVQQLHRAQECGEVESDSLLPLFSLHLFFPHCIVNFDQTLSPLGTIRVETKYDLNLKANKKPGYKAKIRASREAFMKKHRGYLQRLEEQGFVQLKRQLNDGKCIKQMKEFTCHIAQICKLAEGTEKCKGKLASWARFKKASCLLHHSNTLAGEEYLKELLLFGRWLNIIDKCKINNLSTWGINPRLMWGRASDEVMDRRWGGEWQDGPDGEVEQAWDGLGLCLVLNFGDYIML